MAIDHSLTYKKISLRNIGHRYRKWILKSELTPYQANCQSYADFGCSNGYLTSIFSTLLGSSKTVGFDHSDNLKIAIDHYPDLEFRFINLNNFSVIDEKFDIITCFETLEHVGDTTNALKSIQSASKSGTVILISVPIEIGFVGILKYLLKRYIFRYSLSVNCTDYDYCKALLKRLDISQFRLPADGYGSHFGFDYRNIESLVRIIFAGSHISSWSKGTTHFLKILVK